MTSWIPDLSSHHGPRYLAIADRLAADIDAGRLTPGDRLPTHRDLAHRLGVTVGTVTRAYTEATRRGLIGGEVGRGTYVREASVRIPAVFLSTNPTDRDDELSDIADLRLNLPPRVAEQDLLARSLRQLADQDPRLLLPLLDYQPHLGMARHRAVAAKWLAQSGFLCDADRLLLTSGSQHAMMVALGTLAEPGDLVLTEALTFPGLRTLARMLHLKLQGLPMDDQGIVPEAFESVCRQSRPRALYCMPTLQNPTGAVLPAYRRRTIGEIAERYGVALIEDDTYGFLLKERLPSLTSMAPTQGHYIASLSKSVAPGLRTGFLVVPPGKIEAFAAAMQATVWMAAPLPLALAVQWIEDGTAAKLAEAQREEAKARQAIATEAFGNLHYRGHPAALHGWLSLPEPWRADDFAAEARRRGVPVTPIAAFAVTRTQEQAVRLALGAARDRQQLARAVAQVAQLARQQPEPFLSVV